MKKLTLPFLMILFMMGSCTSVNDPSKENLSLIENYIQAVEDLDYNSMDAVLDDDYLGLGPSFGDSIGKVDAIKNWKTNVENLYEKIEYVRSKNAAISILDGENQGDWISNWAELHITYKDGGDVIIWANSIYQIKDKKIVKSFTFYNEADALQQLGYVFVNPNDL
ncbi:nuclear transport factor 2 family protein [Gelidibacter sp.]|uniref:nuclear transport factor 2 family protein n=1 Tax=Gelidibacter sp. TaxID=2018083 RepID=UPI002BB705A7|nr:nuclear transport factor 2 family protein [Gelidibacter sp.]HUH27687.1 nuclear transport factor 2 family protein [Gelidibacter sp.]